MFKILSDHAALIAELGVAWLFLQNFLKALQDALDAEPPDLKNKPLGKIVYYMQAIGGYLFMGQRIQSIGGLNAKNNSNPGVDSITKSGTGPGDITK